MDFGFLVCSGVRVSGSSVYIGRVVFIGEAVG